jgi:hypothetical protein
MPRIEAFANASFEQGIAAEATASIQNRAVAEEGLGEEGLFAGTAPWEAESTASLDGSVTDIALPGGTAGVVQEAGVEIYVDGELVPHDAFVGSWSVSRSRRESVQSFSFGISLEEWGVSRFGDPFAMLGPPTCLKEIDIYGIYRSDTTGTIYRYPLLKRGIVDNVRRTSSPTGGHHEYYNGLDQGAKLARQPVTIVFPVGHGMPRDRMAQRLLEAGGETLFDMQACRNAYKEAQFVDADPVASSQELFDIEGRVVRWNRNGYVVNDKLKPASGVTSRFTITEEDILEESEVTVAFPGDVITEVVVTGTEQLIEEDEVCGYLTAPLTVESYRTFAVFVTTYRQLGDGSLTTSGGSEAPFQNQIAERIITKRTTRCGVLVREEVETYRYYNPWAARYQHYDSSGDREYIENVYLASGASADDDTPAHAWREDKWTLVSRTVTNHYYDAPSYYGPLPQNMAWGPIHPDMNGTPFGSQHVDIEPSGKYLGSMTEQFQWYNPRAAVKRQIQLPSPPVSFDELPIYIPTETVLTTAQNEGVEYAYERFILTNRTFNMVRADEHGFIQRNTVVQYGYAVLANGVDYQYSDGSLSDERYEQQTMIGAEATVYVQADENIHNEVVTTSEVNKSDKSVVRTGLEGAPPAVDYLPGYEPVPVEEALTEEDAEYAVPARLGATRPIKVMLSADDLLTCHLPRIVKTSFPYAENMEELYEAALAMIHESLVCVVTITLAAQFLIEEGTPILLYHRPSGVDGRLVIVDTVTWTGGADSATYTHLVLNIYPEG